MQILLSDKKPKMAYILAESETDLKCLRVLFNNNLIRGAYSFWNGEGKIPKQYEVFQKMQTGITAVLAMGTQNPIEDTTKPERISQFKEQMEKDTEDAEKAKELVAQSNQFDFLKGEDE